MRSGARQAAAWMIEDSGMGGQAGPAGALAGVVGVPGRGALGERCCNTQNVRDVLGQRRRVRRGHGRQGPVVCCQLPLVFCKCSAR